MMSTRPDATTKFWNYPVPKEGPNVPYKNERKPSPAVSGISLVIAAFLMEWLGFVRRSIWYNAGFGDLRKIREHLEDYEPRFDPTVIPIADQSASPDGMDLRSGSSSTKTNLTSKSSLPAKYYSIYDYQAMYKSGEVTPTAVAKTLLPLIRRDISPAGEHSIAWFDSKIVLILAAAKASTLRYKNKCPLGPLDGIPAAVKDEFGMDGYKTTLGSVNDYTGETMPDHSITSWCVRQMEEAGVVILGKLSMHEFGLDTSGNNPIYGTPPNPYNPRYYTGGSSSGSAYAVSTGLIPISLGSDGGGSVRIPSSFCSAFGLKPTHGRLSHHPGANHSNTCAVNGPLASDIRSLAEFYRILSIPGPSSYFPTPSPVPFSPSPHRIKLLGIDEEWFTRASHPIQRICRSLLDNLVRFHSYVLVPIRIPFLVEGQTAHAMTVLNDAATLLPKTNNLTAANKILLAIGRVTPATDYLLAQKLRELLMQHLAHLWAKYPGMIIVTPTTSCAGWPMASKAELGYGVSDGDRTLKTMEYVWMANFVGAPALSVPAGFVCAEGEEGAGKEASDETEGKIPVGLMGMGEWASEEHLLQWGLDAEDIGAELRSRPQIWVDVIARAKEETRNSALHDDED